MKAEIIRSVLAEKAAKARHGLRLMEVCGSHSFAVARAGIRDLLPPGVQLLSGPGCPVCVSGPDFISRTVLLARSGIKIAVFGDLMRIPSPLGTLNGEKGLLVIYSPEEALDYAAGHPDDETVFAAVGFEPTLCAAAALMESARERKLRNFSILCDFKNIMPVLEILSVDPGAAIDGFLLPGHVAAVTGAAAFRSLRVPGVISGFAPENIIGSLALLIEAAAEGRTGIVNHYPAVVSENGSPEALALIRRCFEPADGTWRGLGIISDGNWRIRKEFEDFDAMCRFPFLREKMPEEKHTGCRCGEVLRGRLAPEQCGLYGHLCTPEHPVGACMVSTEGACAASYYSQRKASV